MCVCVCVGGGESLKVKNEKSEICLGEGETNPKYNYGVCGGITFSVKRVRTSLHTTPTNFEMCHFVSEGYEEINLEIEKFFYLSIVRSR